MTAQESGYDQGSNSFDYSMLPAVGMQSGQLIQGNRIKNKMNRQTARNTRKKRREKRKSGKLAPLKPRIESW